MSDILEVNQPTYQMEPDPPRFPLRRLIKYLVWIGIVALLVNHRAEVLELARTLLGREEAAVVPKSPPPLPAPQGAEATAPTLPYDDAAVPTVVVPEVATIVRHAQPKGNPGTWVTADDYPARALREEREGATRFRLLVSPGGEVADCQIMASSGSPDLDAATCAALRKRAHFTPAIDADGRPMEDSWTQQVRWMIPE